MSTASRQRAGLFAAIAVLVLAAALRLADLDLIDLRYDEAAAANFGRDIAHGAWYTVMPFSGSVARHPPVVAYTLALPYLFTDEPLTVAAYRALLDVLAIAVCMWSVRRHFGARAALVAGLAFACAPWAVWFARKLWTTTPAIYGALALAGALEVARSGRARHALLGGVGLALCVGSHWSSLFWAPALGLAIVLSAGRWRVRTWAAAFAPLLLLVIFYAAQDRATDFANIRGLLGATGRVAEFGLDPARLAWWLSGGAHLSDLTGSAFAAWQAEPIQALAWLDDVYGAGLAIALAACAWLIVRRGRAAPTPPRAALLVVVAWWWLPVLLQLRHTPPFQVHYIATMFPAPFVVFAIGWDALLARAPGKSGWLAGLGFAAILIWFGASVARFNAFVAGHETGSYRPARAMLQTAALVRARLCDDAARCPQDVVVFVPADDPSVDGEAAAWHFALRAIPHRFVRTDAGLILRERPLLYVESQPDPALDAMLNDYAAITERVDVANPSGSPSVLLRADGLRRAMPAGYPAVAWDHGASLIGLEYSANANLDVRVWLRVTRGGQSGQFSWYQHVLYDGVKVSQLDGPGIQPRSWRAGDILVHRFDGIPLPALPAGARRTLRVGSYGIPSLAAVAVHLPDGRQDDGVDLPMP